MFKKLDKKVVSHEEEKKFLLKLVNQYADSHKLLSTENNKLKQEISNLKITLKINKELVDKLLKEDLKLKETNHTSNAVTEANNNNLKEDENNNIIIIPNETENTNNNTIEKEQRVNKLEKLIIKPNNEFKPFSARNAEIQGNNEFNFINDNNKLNINNDYITYIDKLKEEVLSLHHHIKSLNHEYDKLLEQSQISDHNVIEEIKFLKEENNKLKTYNFILENKLAKEENKNLSIEKSYQKYELTFTKEVYIITEPTKYNISLNNELETLKLNLIDLTEKNEQLKVKYKLLDEAYTSLNEDNNKLEKKITIKNKRILEYKSKEKIKPGHLNSSYLQFRSNKNMIKIKLQEFTNDEHKILTTRELLKSKYNKNIEEKGKELNIKNKKTENVLENNNQNKIDKIKEEKSIPNNSFSFDSGKDKVHRLSIITTKRKSSSGLGERKRIFSVDMANELDDYGNKNYAGKVWENLVYENNLNYKQIYFLKNNYSISKLIKIFEEFKRKYNQEHSELVTLKTDYLKLEAKNKELINELEIQKNKNTRLENLLREGINNSFRSPILRKQSTIIGDASPDFKFFDDNKFMDYLDLNEEIPKENKS